MPVRAAQLRRQETADAPWAAALAASRNGDVLFAIDRAGLVGADGCTHAGSFDIAYLANLPDFVIMAPSDEAELVNMIETQRAYEVNSKMIKATDEMLQYVNQNI